MPNLLSRHPSPPSSGSDNERHSHKWHGKSRLSPQKRSIGKPSHLVCENGGVQGLRKRTPSTLKGVGTPFFHNALQAMGKELTQMQKGT